MKRSVVIGFLGTQLDYGGKGSARWEKWRPTVALCQQEELIVHRLELLHDARSRGLAESVQADIQSISPETEVCRVEIELRDPW
ncbi:RNA repair transcriptional activator RtcR family protein, partial [Candidatus Accumulibacter phosphatis]